MAEQVSSSRAPAGRRVLLQFPRAFVRGRKGNVMALDIDGAVLRAALAVRQNGKIAVTKLAVEPLEISGDAASVNASTVGAALAGALQKLDWKPAAVAMGVPRRHVMLRTLTFPRTDDMRELAAMVHFQVAKDLPFRIEEAVIDFKVQPQGSQTERGSATRSSRGRRTSAERPSTVASAESCRGPQGRGQAEEAARTSATSDESSVNSVTNIDVLVAAVKRDVVQYYTDVAEAAKLKLAAIGFRPYANAHALSACHLAEPGEAIALVTLRTDEVITDIIIDDSLAFSHVGALKCAGDNSNGEHHEPQHHDSFMQAAAIEVIRGVKSYSGMLDHRPVVRLVIAGDTGREPALAEALGIRLTMPCSVLDAAAALGLPPSQNAMTLGSLASVGLSLAANEPAGLPFDFLNPKRPAQPRNWKRIRRISMACVAVLVFSTLFAIRHSLIQKRAVVTAELQRQIVDEEKRRNIYRQGRLQAKTVEDWIRESRPWLDHLAHLSAILPTSDQVYVTGFSSDTRGGVRLSLQAKSAEVVAELDRKLRAAGYDLKPLAVTPAPDRYGYPFRTTIEAEWPETKTIELSGLKTPVRPEGDVAARLVDERPALPVATTVTNEVAPAESPAPPSETASHRQRLPRDSSAAGGPRDSSGPRRFKRQGNE